MMLVPTIDISNPSATELSELDQACRDHGFFLLAGHGLDTLIDRMWSETERFFISDPRVKETIRRDADNPLGYYDRELTKRKRDNKEVFDYIDPQVGDGRGLNRWPEDLAFRETMTEFFDRAASLATRTLDLIVAAIGFDDTATAREIGLVNDRTTSTVRLNHYPVGDAVRASDRRDLAPLGETALGYHTDPGVLTLLLQDNTGGLQAESIKHGWIDVPPTPGTIVVNLGDVMQVWTNDRYRAAVHRVVPMTQQSRYSIPLFSNPPRDSIIAPLQAMLDHESARARYEAFTWKEYIGGRMSDNFADYGAADIQITDFAIA